MGGARSLRGRLTWLGRHCEAGRAWAWRLAAMQVAFGHLGDLPSLLRAAVECIARDREARNSACKCPSRDPSAHTMTSVQRQPGPKPLAARAPAHPTPPHSQPHAQPRQRSRQAGRPAGDRPQAAGIGSAANSPPSTTAAWRQRRGGAAPAPSLPPRRAAFGSGGRNLLLPLALLSAACLGGAFFLGGSSSSSSRGAATRAAAATTNATASAAPVRLVVVAPLQERSQYGGASWGEVLSHTSQRLGWTEPTLQLVAHDSAALGDAAAAAALQDDLQGSQAALALGVTDAAAAAALAPLLQLAPTALAVGSAPALDSVTHLGGRRPSSSTDGGGGLAGLLASLLAALSGQAKQDKEDARVLQTVAELYSRASSDDLLFIFLARALLARNLLKRALLHRASCCGDPAITQPAPPPPPLAALPAGAHKLVHQRGACCVDDLQTKGCGARQPGGEAVAAAAAAQLHVPSCAAGHIPDPWGRSLRSLPLFALTMPQLTPPRCSAWWASAAARYTAA